MIPPKYLIPKYHSITNLIRSTFKYRILSLECNFLLLSLIFLICIIDIQIYGQSSGENYIQSTTYLKAFKDPSEVYNKNFHIGFEPSDYLYDDGGGHFFINKKDNIIQVSTHVVGLKVGGLKTGVIGMIASNDYKFPNNIDVGDLLTDGKPSGFKLKIQNNALILYSKYFISGLHSYNQQNIPGNQPHKDIRIPFESVGICPDSHPILKGHLSIFGGNSVLLYTAFNTSNPQRSDCGLMHGTSVSLNGMSLPDIEFGPLQSNAGEETIYKARIRNGNTLEFYKDDIVPTYPTECSINVKISLPPETASKITSISYFDGLGKAKQDIQVQGGGQKEDLIIHHEYDQYGRQPKEYLPYPRANSNLFIHTKPLERLHTFYNQVKYEYTSNPYTEKVFESSPRKKVNKQAAPGSNWKIGSGHEVAFEEHTNLPAKVHKFEVAFQNDDTQHPKLVFTPNTYYLRNQLYKQITYNENHTNVNSKDHTTEEYKDKKGRLILKRTFANNIPHDTYYVYDHFDNQTFVIPPKVNLRDGISDKELQELCYQYRYDHRNRVFAKKIPGKDWEYIVYNRSNQPVLTQDAHLRDANQWLFTKYDALGRIIYTGLYQHNEKNTNQRETLQKELNNTTAPLWEQKTTHPRLWAETPVSYTNVTFPRNIHSIHTINYYDNYRFDKKGLGVTPTVFDQPINVKTKGLLTGTFVRILDTDHWIKTLTYYDHKTRPIYIISKNSYLNTIDISEHLVDFTGNILKTRTTHHKEGKAPIFIVDTFTYDHMNRLLTQTQQINDQTPELLFSNTYDALGQLIKKEVGGGLQELDYSYNIRGWMMGINDTSQLGDDLFGLKIAYDRPNAGATPLFNGNISATYWKTANDHTLRGYHYRYDALNRLTDAQNAMGGSAYSLNHVRYDKNGNIRSLSRYGTNRQIIDQLIYQYNGGNQLLNVTDRALTDHGFIDGHLGNTQEYFYDASGNMIVDKNKGILGISYNHFHLPKSIGADNTHGMGSIAYLYDATGEKLQKTVSNANTGTTTTTYAGNFIYRNDELRFFNHPEGYVEPENDGSYSYTYQYKDHLGNIRLGYQKEAKLLLDHDFAEGTQGWYSSGAESVTNNKQRLRVTTYNRGHGATVYRYNVPSLDKAMLSFDIDLGNTLMAKASLWQFSANGQLEKIDVKDIHTSGKVRLNAAIRPDTKILRIKIEKGYTETDSQPQLTTFYVDNMKLEGVNFQIKEEKNYYPFGLQHRGYNNLITGRQHNYGFNGKEENKELGLEWLDFGARNYSAELGRWMNVDPLTEERNWLSTYNYAQNNPIFRIDPDGALDHPYHGDCCGGSGDIDLGSLNPVVITAPSHNSSSGSNFNFNHMPNWISNLDAGHWDTSFTAASATSLVLETPSPNTFAPRA